MPGFWRAYSNEWNIPYKPPFWIFDLSVQDDEFLSTYAYHVAWDVLDGRKAGDCHESQICLTDYVAQDRRYIFRPTIGPDTRYGFGAMFTSY